MKLLTEKEQVVQSQHFAFKLRNLYIENKTMFNEIQDYVPYSIHLNRQDNLDIVYANKNLLIKGPEIEQLLKEGNSFLKKISCPYLHDYSTFKVSEFKRQNDSQAVCSYLQQIQINKKMEYVFATKLFLTNELYFNISNGLKEMGLIGKLMETFFDSLPKSHIFWQYFQTLTKQEKVILKLLGEGHSNKEIGGRLFISHHTVHTHRRNIKKKLGIKKFSDLIKFCIIMDII